jgi:UDP-N-acetylmuramyl pentapeptide phosphotransferase/UDP-N-acetylglucosamine-1-phosphate transferase
VVPLLVSAATSAALLRIGQRLPRASAQPWERTNHAGRPVTLLEGPAWVGGAVGGALAGAALGARTGGVAAGSAVVVAVAAGALGALDDLTGGADDKGLKGHLGALSRGQVTTGAVKIVGLAASGLVGAAMADARTADGGGRGGALATLVGGAVVAGAAIAVNLFDLRPGRALKVTTLAGLPLLGTLPGAVAVGSSAGVVRDDLAARSMLGDTGANAAGALLGVAALVGRGRRSRAALLGALVALTAISEKVSFTRVIERTPVLREVDGWGRRPLAPPAVTPAVILA